ncbi:unnamed protein product [Lupinus luteus]|uniref:Uncharacterized protein n=1 Tax=Lupinus luteus TaxID=3873 RepID=A0AAV1YCZ3_LUPLU
MVELNQGLDDFCLLDLLTASTPSHITVNITNAVHFTLTNVNEDGTIMDTEMFGLTEDEILKYIELQTFQVTDATQQTEICCICQRRKMKVKVKVKWSMQVQPRELHSTDKAEKNRNKNSNGYSNLNL